MKKVSVNICTTPNCYVKAAALFKQLDAMMGTSLKNSIALAGSECSGHYAECGLSQAPCAKVNGRLITNARPADILQATRECLA